MLMSPGSRPRPIRASHGHASPTRTMTAPSAIRKRCTDAGAQPRADLRFDDAVLRVRTPAVLRFGFAAVFRAVPADFGFAGAAVFFAATVVEAGVAFGVVRDFAAGRVVTAAGLVARARAARGAVVRAAGREPPRDVSRGLTVREPPSRAARSSRSCTA